MSDHEFLEEVIEQCEAFQDITGTSVIDVEVLISVETGKPFGFAMYDIRGRVLFQSHKTLPAFRDSLWLFRNLENPSCKWMFN